MKKVKGRTFLLSKAIFLLPFTLYLLPSPLRADSKDPTAIRDFNDGAKAFNAQDYQNAVPYFDAAIEQDSHFAEAYYARAVCHHALKNSDQALQDVHEAIRLNPDYVDAVSLRGILFYEAHKEKQAREDFNFVLSRRPHDPQALLGRGVIALNQDNAAQAQHDFRLFLQLRPQDPLAPRIRKVLASLPREANPPQESPQAESAEATAGEKPQAASASHHVSAATKQMSAQLLLGPHPLSDQVSRKVMRGEQVQVTGDIQSEVGIPANGPPSSGQNQAPQIVEPQ